MRYLLFVIPFAFAVYAFIDCVQTPSRAVRSMPKPAWLLVVWVPVVGGAAWLALGRPAGAAPGRRARVAAPPVAPDDDPEFLRQIQDVDEEHRRLLQQWEDDLRRRERDAGPRETPEDDPPA